MLNTVRYQLVRDNKVGNLTADFNKIVDYLLTFVGDISVQKEREGSVTIYYTGTPITATLITDSDPTKKDTTESSQITLTIDKNDTASVSLIKNVTKNIGYRIFNPQTQSYLVNDPSVLDLTTAIINEKILKIILRYNLIPLLQYHDSLVFFATDKKGRVHLINRHLLEYLKESNNLDLQDNFSVVVAKDVGRFVALFDRGLIPLSYYKYISGEQKINNLSGINIENLPEDVIVEPIYFNLDLAKQSFTQGGALGSPNRSDIKKGGSVIKSLKIKNYLSIKIAQDVRYMERDEKLIPRLSVSIFLDS